MLAYPPKSGGTFAAPAVTPEYDLPPDVLWNPPTEVKDYSLCIDKSWMNDQPHDLPPPRTTREKVFGNSGPAADL